MPRSASSLGLYWLFIACGTCGWFACKVDTTPQAGPGLSDGNQSDTRARRSNPDDGSDAGEIAQPEPDAPTCRPDCRNRECGPDRCGGSCGRCSTGRVCDTRRSLCMDLSQCDGPDASCSRCGNGIIERDEECDGGDACNPDCTLATPPPSRSPTPAPTPPTEPSSSPAPNPPPGPDPSPVPESDVARCMGFVATDASDECKRCVCSQCVDLAIDCYDSGDEARDRGCSRLAECGNRNGCYDFSCYCGSSTLCLRANGPCRAETEAAVGSNNVTRILDCYDSAGCASNRARSLGECLVRNCDAVCGP